LAGLRFSALRGLQRKSYICREFLPNVFPGRNQLCGLLDERVRAPGILVRNIAGHRKNFAILLQRTARGDARSAIFSGFDDEDADGNPADDAVANRKILRRRKCLQCKL